MEVLFHLGIHILECCPSSKIEFFFLDNFVDKMPEDRVLSSEEQEFVAQLSPKELALHKLAIEKLASSYFVWKSHAFMQWKAKKGTL